MPPAAAKSKPKPAVKAGATAKRFYAKSKVAGTAGKKPPAKRGATTGAKSSTQSRASNGYPTQIPRSIYQYMSAQAFNPFNPAIKNWHNGQLPVPNSLGNYNYLASQIEYQMTTIADVDKMQFIMMMWTPSSCVSFHIKENCDLIEHRQGLLHTAKPLFVRPARIGARILNTSRQDVLAGRITIFETQQPLGLQHVIASGSLSNGSLAALEHMIKNSPNTRKYSAIECTKGVEVFLRPASNQAFPEWHPFVDIDQTSADERQALILGALSQACSVAVIAFHGTAITNTYEVQIKAETFCRFGADSIMNTQVVRPPRAHAGAGMADATQALPFG
jgi:hypothetical protein